jgi:hypothetical protein
MKEEKYFVFQLRDALMPLQWTGAEAWRRPEFAPYVGDDWMNPNPEWKCEKLDMTLRAHGREWGVFDGNGELVMRPFDLSSNLSVRPPEGPWVALRKSRVADMALIYDVKARSVMVAGASSD